MTAEILAWQYAATINRAGLSPRVALRGAGLPVYGSQTWATVVARIAAEYSSAVRATGKGVG